MTGFFTWLENTPPSLFVREDFYAYFVLLIFHAWGMAFLIGGGIVVSLRVMGVASGVRIEKFRAFFPWMWFGAAMAALSGIGLLTGYPAKALTNPIFGIKFACLIGAALVVRHIARTIFPLAARREDVPAKARWLGLAALVLWIAGVACGKLLLYTNSVLLVEQRMVSADPYIDPIGIALWAEDAGIASIMYTAWGWPVMEIVHFTGLCLLFGAIGMFDLRMMGAVKGISLKSLHRLVPFGVLGFALCAGSGFMFVTTEPSQYIYNPAWQSKMGLVMLAGLNMAAFYLSGTAGKVRLLGPDDPIPKSARIIAAVSLFSWMGVIACGRVITAFRPPWAWCLWCS